MTYSDPFYLPTDTYLRVQYPFRDGLYLPTTLEQADAIGADLEALGFACTNPCAEVVNHKLVSVYYQREYEINWGGNAPSNAEVAAGIVDRPNDVARIRLPLEIATK